MASEAAARIRASIGELPEVERARWRYDDDEVRVVADAGPPRPHSHPIAVGAFDEDKPMLKHTALMGSPDVGEAVAEHLDAVRAWIEFDSIDEDAVPDLAIEYANRAACLCVTYERLEAVLTRGVD